MRDSATRAAPSLTPNSPATFTSVATGSTGGSVPSSVLARTERAVRGGSASSPPGGGVTAWAPERARPAIAVVLRLGIACRRLVRFPHGAHHGARRVGLARRPPHRAAAGRGQAGPAAAGRAAPHRGRSQRLHGGVLLDPGGGRRGRRRPAGQPV